MPKKLVVLGTGWAGTQLARQVNKAKYDVTVVSPRNHFIFTPLLASTTVGTLEFRNVIEPIRQTVPDVQYYQAECTGFDLTTRSVNCVPAFGQLPDPSETRPFSLPFDVLVIAVGARAQTYNIPGVYEHAFFLKEVADAQAIRQKIIECFERASEPGTPKEERQRLLHFCVVGGGPTGVEFAGELSDCLRQDLQKAFPEIAKDVRITLLEPGKLLGSFDIKLSEFVARRFSHQQIEVKHTGVTRITNHCIMCADGTQIPYGIIVWSTGVVPVPLVDALPLARDQRTHRLRVNENLNVFSQDNSEVHLPDVFAIGDCAVIDGMPLPCTAQVASQQAKYLVKLFDAEANHPPFAFKHMGMMAYVGGYRALAEVGEYKSAGFWSWVLWRSAYLTRLVSWRNKVMVPLQWFKTFVFGRDISYWQSFNRLPTNKKY
eukprot:TRINITY_DN31935_c0_g1_i1.p1 TRINITY_DN31935_c0_g1~~TRINITY_DN31935_c0_g1_i1.p1  ORF type:complete len:441 (+),score=65.25 TRINITY_DN31935_c0_g1_i1:32-1324(+)